MKKIIFLAVLTAMTAVFTACGPSVKKNPFPKTPYATISLEGSGKFGVINTQTGAEILPQIYSNIGYYSSGYFVATNASGIALFDTTGKEVIPAVSEISAKDDYFVFSKSDSKGDNKGIYFIKTEQTISGVYKSLEVDSVGNVIANVTVGQDSLFGVFNTKNENLIPLEYRFLVFDGENYNAAKDKNVKRPMVDPKGNINWRLADIMVFDKDGKAVKKPNIIKAKKVLSDK